MNSHLARRYARERRFARLGAASVVVSLVFLAILLADIGAKGWRAFLTASARVEVVADATLIGANGEESVLRYQTLLKRSFRQRFPEAESRADKREVDALLSFSAAVALREHVLAERSRIGERLTLWLPLSSPAERYLKGAISAETPAEQRGVSDKQVAWLERLRRDDDIRVSFNAAFFSNSDSRDAESAGIGGALVGSFYSLALAFLFSFPIGLLAATYMELFAPRKRWFYFIEVNINNLAAVPSVIFGLLGLAIFINFMGLPRSSPLVGGLVLSLMTLPTIIIAARAALAAVPPSLLSAALSLGATKTQGVFHHVIPAAMPGVLTGAIIGMAQALGETAPLLMIGMVAFIVETPSSVVDAATALPVQIFLWADSPERGFVERAAAAIMALLAFLLVMNAAAIFLRKKLETKF